MKFPEPEFDVKTLELIKKDTYPDYYEDEDEDENPKPPTEPDNKPGKNK